MEKKKMILTAALVYGIMFILIGILGYVPGVTTPEGMLFGLFHVNSAHNMVHILSGIVALACWSYGVGGSRTYFRVFGIIYALVAIMGFFVPHGLILGLITNNPADTWLHVLIAFVALYFGFVHETSEIEMGRTPLREASSHQY